MPIRLKPDATSLAHAHAPANTSNEELLERSTVGQSASNNSLSNSNNNYNAHAHAHAHARETRQMTPCHLEVVLTDESIAKMAGSFENVNPMLDEVWLRRVLREVNETYGNVPEDTVRQALRIAFASANRRLAIPFGTRGFVAFPREFVATVVRAEIERRP